MRTLLYVTTFLGLIGLAFWAYRENYDTQAALDTVEDLQRDIGDARARLAILKAEWAYLNRPDRLRELALLNFPKLELLPMRAEQFGRVDQVSYPMFDPLVVSEPVDVTSAGAIE
ncbi:cell division protein FtsL [Citreicella sp. C3M06]|uniref:cell division protein FtsL n=1 Tax=Roseobacteraceae TaxID=2854170 RepID=UPI001C094757|nr:MULTISPECIES: cell division protein FtsL [Roseobacteraceae]MBU2963293.1 cell division protein FtsL [Citreicella sp. C3M06]MDO6587189.1 cell division protein FtsL [Salipiger sp. 1_MG-2023]